MAGKLEFREKLSGILALAEEQEKSMRCREWSSASKGRQSLGRTDGIDLRLSVISEGSGEGL